MGNTAADKLKESLFYKKTNAFLKSSEKDIANATAFCEDYKQFLDSVKTEREATSEIVNLAKKHGFSAFDCNKKYSAGDKIYAINRNKSVILAIIGTENLDKGVNILASHIDAPRLDLKPCPLYESEELAFFKTHYYGGIKKYQWSTVPMALHGIVVKKSGETINISIGEKDCEPKFCVTDLLIHLSREILEKKASKVVEAEKLNLLIGSKPFDKDVSDAVKLNVLNLLNEKYGISEEDFISAEIEVVPSVKACDIGFDRSMVGAYGQDDRVCAYPSLMAMLDDKKVSKTAVCLFADKEETGSDGNTGTKSHFLRNFISELAHSNNVLVNRVLENSNCLSADVTAAFDPSWSEPFEINNSAKLNYGTCISKYTGHGGKYDASDASAELVGKIRDLFDKNGVCWQIAELGKIDAGGGGTVAKYIAELNVDVLDVGVPVLSMHSPFEVVSKLDVYMSYKAFQAFIHQN